MKRIILCLSLFVVFGSQAQQINPVPDYVFRNQMSVGRNAVTDTAAYISIGPRYGANKGLMPPIVSDTAAITGVKRNGLLIFSVQRNNFQYWDSINSRWTSVTANVDTTVISTRAWRKKGDDSLGAVIATRTDTTLLSTRAWRKKGDDSLGAVIATRTDTTLLSTRAWRQKGLDSLAAIEIDGSGTVNYVPKFTATRTLGNSVIFESGGQTSIGSTSSDPFARNDDRRVAIDASGISSTANLALSLNAGASSGRGAQVLLGGGGTRWSEFTSNASESRFTVLANTPFAISTNNTERLRIFANGRVGINTTTDAGYQLDVNGTLRTVNGANFATTSGNVGIGTTSPVVNLHVNKQSTGISGVQITNSTSGATLTDGTFVGLDDLNAYLWNYENTNLLFATNNTERMRITPGGNVLIGTTTDTGEKFQVAGTARVTQSAYLATASGAVGIGTTSPSEVLHVVGRGRFTTIDSTSSPINVLTSDVNGVIRKTAPGVLGSGTTNYIPKFTASGTVGNSVAFDNGTEILINTTSDAGDYRLQVNGNANFRDDVLIDTNLRVNRHISLDQTPKAWALGNAIEGPQGSALFVAGGSVQTLANIYYDGSYKYSTSNPGAAMFLLQSGITFATYGSGTANGALTGANEMIYAGGELRVGIADQGTFKLQVADKSYFADEVQIASTTDLGNYKLQVTGEAIITAGIRTDAPSGGTAATWKLGTVATVSPTSPNRTIEVEIGGTTYYIHAKTTNN